MFDKNDQMWPIVHKNMLDGVPSHSSKNKSTFLHVSVDIGSVVHIAFRDYNGLSLGS